jgi:hypothetical protein
VFADGHGIGNAEHAKRIVEEAAPALRLK